MPPLFFRGVVWQSIDAKKSKPIQPELWKTVGLGGWLEAICRHTKKNAGWVCLKCQIQSSWKILGKLLGSFDDFPIDPPGEIGLCSLLFLGIHPGIEGPWGIGV